MDWEIHLMNKTVSTPWNNYALLGVYDWFYYTPASLIAF